jgi:hypothetical protein
VTSKESQYLITQNHITAKSLKISLKIKNNRFLRILRSREKRDLTRDSVIITCDVTFFEKITHNVKERREKISKETS